MTPAEFVLHCNKRHSVPRTHNSCCVVVGGGGYDDDDTLLCFTITFKFPKPQPTNAKALNKQGTQSKCGIAISYSRSIMMQPSDAHCNVVARKHAHSSMSVMQCHNVVFVPFDGEFEGVLPELQGSE